nr:hypothetical protein [Tanacetum cinerariifolium]
MDRLSSWYIGLYVEQLEQGGLRVPFSSFFFAVIKHFGVHVSQLVPMGVNWVILFEIRCLSLDVRPTASLFRVFYKLCKQGYWFSFENKTGRGTRKCFKEVTRSLKGWKRKFFLIDRRAIPDAMPWRHGDTDLHDDFLSNFNQDDVERLSEFLVPLRAPPRHLLYVRGLTMACRHPGLSYSIKDQDKNVINMDTFLKLPTWTGTIVSKGDPILEDQRPKTRVTPPLPEKEKQSLARAEAKRAGTEQAGACYRHSSRSCPWGQHVKKKVVELSGNTRVSTPSAMANHPSPSLDHHNVDENPDPNTQSHQSSHQGHVLTDNRYVPNWELRNDLHVCTYRACRELVNHVATPAADEFLGTLSNAEVLSRAYQTLGQSVVAQGELLKRHEQLNHDYVDLWNCHDTNLAELERLRSGLRKANQDKDEITKNFTLLDNAHSKCTSREKELLDMVKELERERGMNGDSLLQVEVLERERLALSAQLSQSKSDRKKLMKEFIPTVVTRLHTSVEYRKSLVALVQLCFTVGWLGGLTLGRTEEEVARFLSETQDLDIEGSKSWEERHQALFTMPYPYVQKIADSCNLSFSELWSVHPDAPSPEGVTLGAIAESTIQQPPSTSSKITSDIPFKIPLDCPWLLSLFMEEHVIFLCIRMTYSYFVMDATL